MKKTVLTIISILIIGLTILIFNKIYFKPALIIDGYSLLPIDGETYFHVQFIPNHHPHIRYFEEVKMNVCTTRI
ncbi:hypothetical protein J2T56_002778 [Natronobacillus azotifigens]